MSFKPSIDTINYIFTNVLRDLTDANELFVGGNNVLPYLIYLVQQQQAEIASLKSENEIKTTHLSEQADQIAQLTTRLNMANL
jgi:hypothetical protein